MKLSLLGLVVLTSAFVLGQKATYEKIFYKNVSFENDVVKVEIDNIVSLEKETKFRMSITNKTNSYLIYNSEESNFDVPGQDVRAKDKSLLIEPNSTKKKVFRAFGNGLNAIEQFKFSCEGFYVIHMQNPLEAPEFRLPASSNKFTAGNFESTLSKSSKSTAKTDVKFNVTYKGDQYGFIFPSLISVRMPDGNNYATTKSKDDVIILKKGESDSYTASWDRMPGGRVNDMQLVEMFILFTGVFVEGTTERVAGQSLLMEMDDAMTQGKNK